MAGSEVTIDRDEIRRLLRGDDGLAELLERVPSQVLEAEGSLPPVVRRTVRSVTPAGLAARPSEDSRSGTQEHQRPRDQEFFKGVSACLGRVRISLRDTAFPGIGVRVVSVHSGLFRAGNVHGVSIRGHGSSAGTGSTDRPRELQQLKASHAPELP